MLPIIWPLEFLVGEINESSVYMHCCGWNLRGWMWLYWVGRKVIMGVGVLVLGVFFHVLEKLMWYCVGVGLLGYVSIWMLSVFFRMCCSLWGACRFVVKFTWLCIHIIDVSDESTFW
jgi:hypothetical protein